MALRDFLQRLRDKDDERDDTQSRIFKEEEFVEDKPSVVQRVGDFAKSAVKKIADPVNDALDYQGPSMRMSVRDAIDTTKETVGEDFRDTMAGKDTFLEDIPLVKDALNYQANRIAYPIGEVPENIDKVGDKELPLIERGAAGLMTAGAMVPGIDDAAYALAFDVPKAAAAGKSKMKAFTGEEFTSLGEAMTKEEGKARTAFDYAELPLMLAAGSVVGQKQAVKNLASQADKTAAVAKSVGRGLTETADDIKPKVMVESLDDAPPAQPPQKPPTPTDPSKKVILDDEQVLRSTEEPKFRAALKYYDTTEDVKQTIVDMANRNIEGVQEARRGKVTFKETRQLSDALGMSIDDVEKRKIGTVWSAEEVDAATRIAIDVNERGNELSRRIRAMKEAGEEIPAELEIQQMDLAAQQQAVIASILGDNAEAGRALNARKMLKQALETGDLAAKKEAMKMFAGDEDTAKRVIEHLNSFDPDDNLGRMKYMRQIRPSTTIEKAEEYWYNSILSNASTHVVNTVSNAAAALMSIPERAMAGTIDAAGEQVAKVLGKAYKRDRFAAEAAAATASLGSSYKRGIRRAMYSLKHGITEGQTSKLEFKRANQAIKGKAGEIINIPSKALTASDEFFKAINYEMDLNAQAVRMAKNEGLSGPQFDKRVSELIAEPTEKMMELAQKEAKYRAFQADSKFGSAVSRMRDMGQIDLGKLGEFRPLRFIIPFIQTPINVLKYGLERSPVGFVGTAYKAGTKAPKAEVIDSASRAALGSMMLAPLAMYFTEEKITGAPPKNKKERDAFYADGKLPYSIKIGDNWIAYNRLEPINTVLTQLAMWHDASKDGEATTVEQIAEFMRGTGRNIADQTFLTGIGSLVEAIEDPGRYGERFLTNIVGGFVPSFVAAGARSIDDNVRKPETFTQSIQARIPGMSQQVPAMESDFETGGDVIRHTNEGKARNFASNFLGFRTSRDKGTDYQGDVQKIRAADQETRDKRVEVEKQAEEFISNVRTADDKAQAVREAAESGTLNPEVMEQVTKDIKKVASGEGLSKEMSLIKNYSNETKARYVIDKMRTLEPEEKTQWLSAMMGAEIITQATIAEIQKVLAEDELPLIDR